MNECPKCQAPYSDEETECKKCGIIFDKFNKHQEKKKPREAGTLQSGESDDTQKQQRKKRPSMIVMIGGGFLSICVFAALYSAIIGNTGQKRNHSSMAFTQCQSFVKDELISPSTADFPFLDYSANVSTDNLYIIKSYVDSQNGFGATIRTNWRCKARYLGGDHADPRSWKLVDLQLYKR